MLQHWIWDVRPIDTRVANAGNMAIMTKQNPSIKGTAGSRVRLSSVPFEVDKQTWKDLDLFDQGRRGLIFALFNKTKTDGGGDALERMLKDACNELPVLEARRNNIRFFRDRNIELRIGRQVADVEHYLNCAFELFPENWLAAFGYQLRNQLKESPRYYTVATGIKATVSLLRYLFEVTATWKTGDCPGPLAATLHELPELITDPMVRVLLTDRSGPLRWRDLSRCDHFFRESGRGAIRRLVDLLYEWDAYQSVAAAAQQYDLCFPQYSHDPQASVRVEGLFHPLVANAVPNDYVLGGEANLSFISGPNMAGKSTFLKSFGLAVYLAHVGFPVPARSFQTTIFNGLMMTVNLADSISQGYSHFYAEVRRVKEVVAKLAEKQRLVVIFDELFRGTNVRDASDASLQIIDALADIEGSLFLVSTHIVEIAAGLQDNPNIGFVCFSATMEGGIPWYSYKLRGGVSDERAGMMILRNEGILDMLEEMRKGG
jgi:DNA mismatch repair protein MutS